VYGHVLAVNTTCHADPAPDAVFVRMREHRLLREALSDGWRREECTGSRGVSEVCTLALVAGLEVSELASLIAVPRCPGWVKVSASTSRKT
jgi:hypothetical protein